MTMNSRSRFEKVTIKPHDIFYAEHFSHSGAKIGHYFYCIHSQEEDASNHLFRDVLALIITTKKVPGYNVEVFINGRVAYVCCDNPMRIAASTENVDLKRFKVPIEKQREILTCMKYFNEEIQRQLKRSMKF